MNNWYRIYPDIRRRGASRGALRGGGEGDIPREPLRPLPQKDTHPGTVLRVRHGKKDIGIS